MFERFTQDARRAVIGAQDEARGLGHGWIGTEHLLLAVLDDESSPVAAALRDVGLTAEAVRAEVRRQLGPVDDSAALAGIGIDLDEVRRRVEDRFGAGALDDATTAPVRRRSFRRLGRRSSASAGSRPAPGPGHIPFTRRAKKSLELTLREAVAAKSHDIGAAHLVLGLMREDGLAARAVTSLGVPPETVRRTVQALDRAA
jgi:ATP-dependent Clp protease ATP-binding subunit ClpA